MNLAQGAILVVLGVGVRGLFSMRDELRKLNEQTIAMDAWQVSHEHRDDERFGALQSDLRELRRSVARGQYREST